MNLRLDLRVLGGLLLLLALFQLLPAGAALVFYEAAGPYAASSLVTLIAGLALFFLSRPEDRQVRPRDGFFIVGCSWLLCSLFGALPYLFAGSLAPVDAFFESTSGFTTTGSTVLTQIESKPRALLLWRAFTQWLGGMGIIVFSIAILPLLGIGGMQLFRAEIPGPIADKVRPRVAATARRLWYLYVGFTAAEVVALRLAGLPIFESVCHAFTTMATGGFSTMDASVEGFANPAAEWIIILFMLLGGINFVIHYRVLVGQGREAVKDDELRYYLLTVIVAVVIMLAALTQTSPATGELLRRTLFTGVAILTTTGYHVTDYEAWPFVAQFVILILMFIGGMAGSTSGGAKSLRMLIGLRAFVANVSRLIHPHAVRPVKYGGRTVPENVLLGVWAYFAAYVVIAAAAGLVVASSGYDLTTAFSSALSAVSNIGPGLGDIGPTDTFAHFPGVVKVSLALCMIAGRLEIFTLVVLLLPAFWRT